MCKALCPGTGGSAVNKTEKVPASVEQRVQPGEGSSKQMSSKINGVTANGTQSARGWKFLF